MKPEIRFYKNFFTDAQVIELARLDDVFVGSGDVQVKFHPRNQHCHWYDDSGSYQVYSGKEPSWHAKTSVTNCRLHPHMDRGDMNAAQMELYLKMVNAACKVVECPYVVIESEDQMAPAFSVLGRGVHRLHKFPFIVGREPGFTFQAKMKEMSDYIDFEYKRILRYVRKEIPQGTPVGGYETQPLR